MSLVHMPWIHYSKIVPSLLGVVQPCRKWDVRICFAGCASKGSVPCSIRRLVSTTEWLITLFPDLTKMVPKYAVKHGQHSAVAWNSCFSTILCLFRPLLYPAKVSGLTSECEYNNMWCPGMWWSQNSVVGVATLYSWTVQVSNPGGGKRISSSPKYPHRSIPSFLFVGYWGSFPKRKEARVWTEPITSI